ncbi:iron-sulfur cluster assembly accessory protein [Phormidium tenue FACHB-886]|nr:iron-sulfur cluster assembly accessory protein [Phormidium tenue FACHB-886]
MAIQLSPAAVAEVNRIRAKHPNPEARFRLGIAAGGCADWHYILTIDDQPTANDRSLTCDGVAIVVDAQSWAYLDGLALDYSEDLMGGGFRFNNPNAAASCGCGNSFSVSNPGGESHKTPSTAPSTDL